MKYRYLGNSGLLVSRICLGTMTYGTEGWGCDRDTAIAITNTFVDAGGNFIDTADMYSQGVSEEMLGAAVAQHDRDDLVLATKSWFRTHETPNAKGSSRKHMLAAVEASLQRLGTDYIDLYQMHGPDPFTPLEETLRAADDLVRSGKVRYLGCSNYYGWQIVKANAVAERMGLTRFVSAQNLYNLVRRDIEREILGACEDQGVGMLCWSPLASGLLTGKYDKDQDPPKDSRIGMRADIDLPRYWNDDSFCILDEVRKIAAETERTPAQVAIAWLLSDRRVTAVIVGARTVEQLQDNLEVGDWDLPEGHYSRLANVVPFDPGYPQDWIDLTWNNIAGEEEFSPWKLTRRPRG